MDETQVSRKSTLRATLALLAGFLALSSAGAHFLVAPEHFQEGGGYGVFFLVVASLQVLYGLGLLVRGARLAVSPWYLVGGILGSLLVMEVYVVSRTLGIPLLGPHAGHVEAVATIDVVSKALELGLVATLAALLVRLPGFKPSFGTAAKLATVGFLSVSLALVLAGVFTREEHESFAVFPQPELPSSSGAPAQTLPTWEELSPLLTRGGWGPGSTSVDVIYAPLLLFQVDGEEPPASSLERPTAIFFMSEADHEHVVGIPPQPPQLLLRVDGGELIEPYEVTVLAGGGGGDHRTSQLMFPLPSGLDPATIDQEEHAFTLVMPLGEEGESTFSWQLPLVLPGENRLASSSEVADENQASGSGLRRLLTRSQEAVAYEGGEGIRVEATYATLEYFVEAMPQDAMSRYLPEQFTVFLLTERLHTADLPGSPPDVVLSLDGQTYKPDLVEEVTVSPHHRVTLVRFSAEPPAGLRHRLMELRLPGGESLEWHLPLRYAGAAAAGGFRWTPGFVIALLGGVLAAMWPCLFQLTVFFIPALGGLSMQDASTGVPLRRRMSVVKAALFFVLGFTLVYTAAGALIGLAAQRLGETPNFQVWQRYIGIVGGGLIILLALRVAAKVRAPLVCKMPMLSKMAHNRRPANPLEMMFAGLAFATGCMTCFGAALVVAMVVYVGLSGSAALGALTLFVFSLGMGIPLIIAATAMAKVLPMLFRLEKVIPWMGLGASLLMVGFAVLLITGNYMVLTEWVYRALPAAAVR